MERKYEKERLRNDEEVRQLADLSIYSAPDNPFHDTNLEQQFKWHKKAEKDKRAGITPAQAQERETLRKQEAQEELERLNRRRAQREVEMKLREAEESRAQRTSESAQMAAWVAKDDIFQLEQERRRAVIRIKDRRAKAVDFLALNLRFARPDFSEHHEEDLELDDPSLEIDLDEPYNILNVRAIHI